MPRSSIIISDMSALLFHRARRLGLLGSPTQLSALSAMDLVAKAAALGIPLPVDVCASRASERVRASWARNHVIGSLNEAAIEWVSPSLGVMRPASALCQLANRADDITPLLLAYEVCGSYALDPAHPDGFQGSLRPLVSAREIEQAVLSIPSSPSSGQAIKGRRLARAVVDGAASPAEAKLCLAMCLPRLSGGFGLPKPELNSELAVTGLAQSLTSKRTIYPDSLWKREMLILEYQGSYHSGQTRIESDAGRDNALLAMGYRVIHVTRRQVASYDLYQGLMESIRVALGQRMTIPSARMLERRYELWRQLYRNGRAS